MKGEAPARRQEMKLLPAAVYPAALQPCSWTALNFLPKMVVIRTGFGQTYPGSAGPAARIRSNQPFIGGTDKQMDGGTYRRIKGGGYRVCCHMENSKPSLQNHVERPQLSEKRILWTRLCCCCRSHRHRSATRGQNLHRFYPRGHMTAGICSIAG